jgi:hypothetical protein
MRKFKKVCKSGLKVEKVCGENVLKVERVSLKLRKCAKNEKMC